MEQSPKKRWFACHCPLARSALWEKGEGISPEWCYCSGGYQKLLFDTVFGEPVGMEVLETALGGSPRCRFAMTIPARFLR